MTRIQLPTLPMDMIYENFASDDARIIGEVIRKDRSIRTSIPRDASGRGKFLWRVLSMSVNPQIAVLPDHNGWKHLWNEIGDNNGNAYRAEAKRLYELALLLDCLIDDTERSIPTRSHTVFVYCNALTLWKPKNDQLKTEREAVHKYTGEFPRWTYWDEWQTARPRGVRVGRLPKDT